MMTDNNIPTTRDSGGSNGSSSRLEKDGEKLFCKDRATAVVNSDKECARMNGDY